MKSIRHLIVWICKHFTRDEIFEIINDLIIVLKDKHSDVKPKDEFKEKHPNYRDFKIDPLAPFNASEIVKPQPELDYNILLQHYMNSHGKPLKPIHPRSDSNRLSEHVRCPHCNAPHNYIYYNDGKKRSQLKCKICQNTFQLIKRFRRKAKYYCPYCQKALFIWKERPEVTIHKCHNKKCPHRLKELNKLNDDEIKLREERSSQFKISYQYREYHYEPDELKVAEPHKPRIDLKRIHNNMHTFALILTRHISYAITARKTAHMLKNIWGLDISYQTVLNYTQAAAYYCHKFNLKHKGAPDDVCAGDESYTKVFGIWHYVWFFIGAVSRKICGYHFSDNRGAKDAITTMLETIRTSESDQKLTFITDGNPSYQAGIHYINAVTPHKNLKLHKVIGLQNLDTESELYRPSRPGGIIERLNRTYKYHVQDQNGFGSISGAVAKLVLFVTYYNFLRPHKALNYETPVHLPELDGISTIQDKWIKVLSLAA